MEHGGLDTLAALCGGASKAYTDETENEKSATSTDQTLSASSSGIATPPVGFPLVAPRTAKQGAGQPASTSQEAQSVPLVVQMDPSMQQWQALATAAAFGNFPNPAASAAFASIFQAAAQNPTVVQQSPAPNVDPNTYMQQFAYYQYLAAAQAQHMAAQNSHQIVAKPSTQSPAPSQQPIFTVDSKAVAPFAYEVHPVTPRHHVFSDASQRMSATPQQHSYYPTQQVIPGPPTATAKPSPASSQSSMQPPLPPSQATTPLPNSLSVNTVLVAAPPVAPRPAGSSPTKIFPHQKPLEAPIARRPTQETPRVMHPPDGKKQLKRAANRRSAQLSRKRKKLYIEELKEENDELRRKEQILMSIPDLIVVFDSAGKLWFVSQSVNRFLDFVPEELEGTSFWNRLCEESVRLLKAAFMDALAARNVDMDTAPLGSGVWELRLLDKDGSHKVVTLNGVVHFSGDAPECVCSIRPRDNKTAVGQVPVTGQAATASGMTQASINTVIKPHQSFIARTGGEQDGSCRLASSETRAKAEQRVAGDNGRLISDGDSGSVTSESGSE